MTSARNIDLVRSLGAAHVMDYTATDFVGGGRRYDLILDAVGNRRRGAPVDRPALPVRANPAAITYLEHGHAKGKSS